MPSESTITNHEHLSQTPPRIPLFASASSRPGARYSQVGEWFADQAFGFAMWSLRAGVAPSERCVRAGCRPGAIGRVGGLSVELASADAAAQPPSELSAGQPRRSCRAGRPRYREAVHRHGGEVLV